MAFKKIDIKKHISCPKCKEQTGFIFYKKAKVKFHGFWSQTYGSSIAEKVIIPDYENKTATCIDCQWRFEINHND